MEVMLLIALVALMVGFVVRATQNKRVMVRVPARVSQPKVMRRRY